MGQYEKKYSRNKKYKKMKVVNIVLAVLLLACVALVVFLLAGGELGLPQSTEPVQTQNSGAAETTGAAALPEETVETQDSAILPEDTEMIWIETPYIRLGYPAEWESYLRYDQKEEDGVFTESFYCCIEEEQIPLFDIHFGSEALGEQMGYLLLDGEKIPFSFTPYEYTPSETWREDDVYVLYAMQEGVNDVIRSVMDAEAYTAQ